MTNDRIDALAEALRGKPPTPLPNVDDYVKITEINDADFDKIGRVVWVTDNMNPNLRDVHITVDPLGNGSLIRRPISPEDIRILTAMEVIAEASK